MDDALTVDELAARTGTTVRNVRFYTAEGLLPAPERRGRVAYYTRRHRARLDLIGELQAHGYSLAAIQRALATIPPDAPPLEVELRRALLVPTAPEEITEFSHAELDARAGRRLSALDLDFLVEVGALGRVVGTHRFRATPSLFAVGVELLDLDVPAGAMREAAAVIDRHARAMAAELADVMDRGIWEPFRRGEFGTDDPERVAAAVARLRPLTIRSLIVAFERAAARAMRAPDDV